jgi:phage baseplate assembly protein W
MPTAQPIQGPLDFSAEGVDEVLQNVGVILATREGTVPLDRAFGVSWEWVDDPRPVAEQRARAEVADKIEKHEPRAEVEEVRFEDADVGRLTPIVTLRIDLDAA